MIEIQPTERTVTATVRPPGSKSLTNRALVCAALATGKSRLVGALDSEDTRVMIESLRRLGMMVESQDDGKTLTVTGAGGKIPAAAAELDVRNSGTTLRFLTALVALGEGRYRLDGVERMRQRPVQDLLQALQTLGVDARSELGSGCPPVLVEARGLAGGDAEVRGDISSQFLSGLLLAAPYARHATRLSVIGPLVSQPYVEMTLAVMADFGIDVHVTDDLTFFEIPHGQPYCGREYAIEPDASTASYFFAAAAITGGRITVVGLSRASLQGDVAFCDCLAAMGCKVQFESDSITVAGRARTGIDIDMSAISDTVQTLAAVALFADGPTTIRGVGHIRHKETDRIGNLAIELRKLGARVTEHSSGLTIEPDRLRGARLATYDDHRMAMSLALVGLKIPGVLIEDPECTVKTYPGYFADLALLMA